MPELRAAEKNRTENACEIQQKQPTAATKVWLKCRKYANDCAGVAGT